MDIDTILSIVGAVPVIFNLEVVDILQIRSRPVALRFNNARFLRVSLEALVSAKCPMPGCYLIPTRH